MNKLYVILYVSLIIIFSASVIGMENNLYYDDYLETNVLEAVTLTSDVEITNQSAWIWIDGTLTNMSKLTNFSWGISISNTVESDVHFIINIGDSGTERINGSDNSADSYLTIADQRVYSFINRSSKTINDSRLENNDVCAYIKKGIGSPLVRAVIRNQNGTNNNGYLNYGVAELVTNLQYETVCFEKDYIYLNNYTDLTEFYGIQCTNCDANNKISLGIDTTTPNGLSANFINGTNYTSYLTGNYMITAVEWEGEVSNEIRDVFYFREPYYITFQFFQGLNTSTKQQGTYESLFDYVYLYEQNDTNGITTPAYLGGIIDIFALIPGTGDFYDDQSDRYTYDRDIKTFFWDQYESGSATIKLYNLAEYKLNILGSDVMSYDSDFGEFNKPKPGNKRWQTQVTSLDFNESFDGVKRNTTFNVYLQPWEANKSQFMLDIVKWLLVIGLLAVIIGVEVGLRVPGVVIIYTIFGYAVLMGGIGWLV